MKHGEIKKQCGDWRKEKKIRYAMKEIHENLRYDQMLRNLKKDIWNKKFKVLNKIYKNL